MTLTLWTMPNSPKPKEDLQKMVEPFTAKTGVKVDVQEVGWDVQFDRIRNAAVSGEGPDITQAGTTQVPFFAALGGFTDLSDRVEDIGGKGAYAPGHLEHHAGRGPGRHVGDPVVHRGALDLLPQGRAREGRRRSGDRVQGPRLLQGHAAGDQGQGAGHRAVRRARQEGVRPRPPVMPFVWDNGGAELSDDAKQSTINSPEAQQGVEFMGGLITAGLFDKCQLERDGTQVENQFKGGRLAVWIGGPWVLGSIDRAEDDTWTDEARENVGVAPMPTGPGGKAYTFVGGSDLMVFKSTKHPNEAWALLKFLSEDQTQKDYAKLLGMFPARLEPQQQVGDSSENHKAFFEAIQSGRTYAPIPQWGQIENAYKTRFGNILDSAAGVGKDYSEATVKSQLDAAAKEADGLLAQSARVVAQTTLTAAPRGQLRARTPLARGAASPSRDADVATGSPTG